MSQGEQEFCLRWSNHENNICLIFESMLKRGVLVDVTLKTEEGKSHRVHRAILSACSPYFEDLFTETDHPHPIIILKDVKSEELKSLIDYIYTGSVTVKQSNLDSFMKIAESLKIRGLVNHVEPTQGDLTTNNDNCVPLPLRKRRRKLSAEMNQPQFQSIASTELQGQHRSLEDRPTDLSLPKSDSETAFQPVLQAVSYSAIENNDGNACTKVYLKPKEALISPPLSEWSEGSSLSRSHNEHEYIQVGTASTSDDVYVYTRNELPILHEKRNEPGTSHANQISDDEDAENYQESEGAPMVRSGICTVCGCFRSDLRQHMDSHSGQSFSCNHCGRAYPRRKTLNQHIKRSHPGLLPDSNMAPR